jgi:hypothetical protein
MRNNMRAAQGAGIDFFSFCDSPGLIGRPLVGRVRVEALHSASRCVGYGLRGGRLTHIAQAWQATEDEPVEDQGERYGERGDHDQRVG